MNAVVIATGCVFHHELSRMLRKTNEKTARQTSPTNVQVILATLIMNWRSRGDSAFSTLAFVLSTPLRTPTIGPRIAPANPTDAAALGPIVGVLSGGSAVHASELQPHVNHRCRLL